MPATRTATASARCTSTQWRVSGHCSAPGCVRIAASRRRSCQSISASLSSCTTRAGAEKPCSAPLSLPWSGDVLHHPGSRQEPSRFLANGLVCCDDIMAPFAREILAWRARSGEPIPLILDQTKASDRHQILMLSVRWGERALPLAWRVAETQGAIGFATQQELLEVVAGWLAVGQAVILLADRFYGTPEMICWCCDRGWDYRLRLKGNLVARLGATRTTTGALALSGGHYFENIILTGKQITTNLGIIRDPGHTEPWIIAMSAKPGYLTTLPAAGHRRS